MTFVSYAQNFEDVILWRALHDVRQGRYLDIGAHDPVVDSVSLAFYEAGWRGMHVEAIPFYADRLRTARPDETVIEAAVTDADGPIEFHEIPGTGLSTGKAEVASRQASAGYPGRKIVVPCVRLDQLLQMTEGDLHWLKIDTEGMEADVLQSWGQSKRRPWVLVIESTFPGTQEPTEQLWVEHVLSRGYRPVFFDGLSRFFLHESHNELADRFAAPANVFDAFAVAAGHFAAREVAGSLNAELTNTRAIAAQDRAHLAAELDEARASAAQSTAQLAAELHEARASAAQNTAQLTAELERLQSIAATAGEERDSVRAALEAAVVQRDEAAAERELARQETSLAQVGLLAAEKEHSAALDVQWRERLMAEEQVRRVAREAELSLRNELQLAEAAANQLRVELSRSDERSAQQQELLRLSDQAIAAIRDQDVQARQEADRLHTLLDDHRTNLAKARSLITDLLYERASRWQQLGIGLGFVTPSPAIHALTKWIGTTEQVLGEDASFHPEKLADTGTSMLGPAAKELGNPYLRANSLPELLSWKDVNFVRCAYVTILGRQPDPEGEAYYSDRIRRGHSKMEVLRQLRRSEEARNHDPGIAGLDRALRRAAWRRAPIIGSIIRAGIGNSREEPQDYVAHALLESNALLHSKMVQMELRLTELDLTLATLTVAINRQPAAPELQKDRAKTSLREVRVPPVIEASRRIREEWLAA